MLDDILRRHGDLIRHSHQPSLALRPDVSASGRSRLGGSRMLAYEGESWPTHRGTPLTLLAQVDFAECPLELEGLPSKGILQALIDTNDLPVMGESDLQSGAARIRVLEDSKSLYWISAQEEKPCAGIRFEAIETLRSGEVDGLTDEENDVLALAYWAAGHRVLGAPTQIQYDPFDYPQIYNPRENRVLVLQIDGDDAMGWHWVHQGVLHFLADGEAFKCGRVEDALFDMQFL
jgi:uncharacterized protein YwqG